MENNTNPIKPEIQPNDKVIFNGMKATVLSTWPDNDDVVILCDGMTIECEKKQLKLYGKIDTMDVPMKFKDGLPVSESKVYVRCNIIGNSSPLNSLRESFLVDFNEWSRKKGKQKVKLITEEMHEEFDVPKTDIRVVDIPDSKGKEGFVDGVLVGMDGEAERNVKINASEYASCTDDSARISVLFITPEGYEDGKVLKSRLKTLSV